MAYKKKKASAYDAHLAEERLRAILDTVSDGYYEVDPEGKFIFFNKQMAELYGYTPEEIVGMHYTKYMTEDTAVMVFEVFNNIYRTGKPARIINYVAVCKDGTHRNVEISASLMKDRNGNKIGFRGMARDITERKQNEEALRQSEERYRTILDTITEGYSEVDLKGNYTFCSKQMCELFGCTGSEILGSSYRQFMDEATAKKIFSICNDMYVHDSPPRTINYEATRKDGARFHIELTLSLKKNRDGRTIGFHGMSRDVTERIRSEEALRQSEERYRTILGTVSDGYYEADLKGNFLLINRQAADIFGYTEDEFRGLTYLDLISRNALKKFYTVTSEILRTGVPCKAVSFRARRKDGTEFYNEISISPINNREGKITGFRGLGRDVTERKLAEHALERSEKILKERNEIIERDLENAMLIQKSLVASRVPIVPEVTVGYKYLPLEAVGGDYFSFTHLQEGGLGVFIGDVSNHGVSAALFLSLIKATTDRICRNHALYPQQYLKNLNDDLLDNMPMSFLTCIYGVFETRNSPEASRVSFTFSKAGHPLPILYRASSGTVEQLQSRGILIGMFDEIKNENTSVTLEKGDRIFLYTDGIPETVNERGEMFGFNALPDLIGRIGGRPLEETLDTVIEELERFKGNEPFRDDIVLIGMEIK